MQEGGSAALHSVGPIRLASPPRQARGMLTSRRETLHVCTSVPLSFFVRITDALLSHKFTKFSTMGFRALFNVVFFSLGLTMLQLVLAFHAMTSKHGNTSLYTAVLCVSIVNLGMGFVVGK